jgi:hypothetical protein
VPWPYCIDAAFHTAEAAQCRFAHVDHAIGLLPDAMKPGIHCVRTHWIRGFIAFQLARRVRTVMLMVPV